MKRLLLLVAVVTKITFCHQANAFTGNDLMQRIEAEKRFIAGRGLPTDAQDAALVLGFALGVAITLDELDSKTCLPKGWNAGQLKRVLIQYTEANPAELNKSAEILAIAAFRQAFPCSRP